MKTPFLLLLFTVAMTTLAIVYGLETTRQFETVEEETEGQ